MVAKTSSEEKRLESDNISHAHRRLVEVLKALKKWTSWFVSGSSDLNVLPGCPVVGREMLATRFPNDWLDQTMSYQLIQTTSFAMHPRLPAADYNQRTNHLLNFIAKTKCCRINLFKRHRFAIAISKYRLLVNSCLRLDNSSCVPAGPPSFFSACSWSSSFQLIHYAPAGSTWPPPDYEQLTQLWTSPLLIQLPYTMMN
ncbi:transcription factor CYCLOIDEA [Dorcoceras hygrometricum]|uniref:Transcription factor CYCLOIDEA n=1 Tax=Dorcoceras hygrometricum TaxID=472368 RepID=A0A2Z7A087_9LAMI|nr:transcription factor CYCLOIDEA [Dorcoceras hygrometricum]